MPDPRRYHHISSAVVTVMPGRMEEVLAMIARLDGPEIRAHDGNRIVVVIEGASAGELGGLLTTIGGLAGVIAANMVFEHIEELEGTEP